MLTRIIPSFPQLTGDWGKDGPPLIAALLNHFHRLNDKGALAIAPFGNWTPVVTFATPGDLSVAYSYQVGVWTQIEDVVIAQFAVDLSTFTHTTASGDLTITGLPFTSRNVSNLVHDGACAWKGITKAGYTDIVSRIAANSSTIKLLANGTAVASSFVGAADMPTGGAVVLNSTIILLV